METSEPSATVWDDASAFTTEESQIAHDTHDGEVMIIHHATGLYFSTTGSGATAWNALRSGRPMGDVITEVARHHDVAPTDVADDMKDFAAQLVAESLLVRTSALPQPLELPDSTESLPWTPPILERFTDMADLLTFDPIHEVDVSGWPNVSN
jgi:hypothetical protein